MWRQGSEACVAGQIHKDTEDRYMYMYGHHGVHRSGGVDRMIAKTDGGQIEGLELELADLRAGSRFFLEELALLSGLRENKYKYMWESRCGRLVSLVLRDATTTTD